MIRRQQPPPTVETSNLLWVESSQMVACGSGWVPARVNKGHFEDVTVLIVTQIPYELT